MTEALLALVFIFAMFLSEVARDPLQIILPILAIAAVAHLIEEAIKEFARFFNLEILHSGRPFFPISRGEAFFKDQLGLGVALVGCCVYGREYPALGWIVIGFTAADAAQHVYYSFTKLGYTPGVATAPIYGALALWAFCNPEPAAVWVLVGVAALAGNIAVAVFRLRQS